MENKQSEHSVTRRDFLARSGKIAGAVPAVTLLMSTTAMPGMAVAGYHGGTVIPGDGGDGGDGDDGSDEG